MERGFLLAAIFTSMLASSAAFGIENLDCDGSQRSHPACQLPVWKDGRCESTSTVQNECHPASNACREYGGGACWGNTVDGRWFTLSDGETTKRCKCGCFAEETEFAVGGMTVTGTELLADKRGRSVESLDRLDGRSWSVRAISEIVGGPEKDPAYRIVTRSGRVLELSKKHPVAVGNELGIIQRMTTPDQLAIGDFLVSDDGLADQVSSVVSFQYEGRMVNFLVDAERPDQRLVSANGLVTGDNAWQQRLAMTEARILERADILQELRELAQEAAAEL